MDVYNQETIRGEPISPCFSIRKEGRKQIGRYVLKKYDSRRGQKNDRQERQVKPLHKRGKNWAERPFRGKKKNPLLRLKGKGNIYTSNLNPFRED